jgi:uncharacterized protein
MNSCLYKAKVKHHRLLPKEHRFQYTLFMFYLDLDEIDKLAQGLTWMSRNKFNLFNFRDRDHLQLPAGQPDTTRNVRQHLVEYLHTQKVDIGQGRICLLTNLCTLGYQFNPVSFYFCFDEQDRPLCTVVEVGNTFREMKPYFIGRHHLAEGVFSKKIRKYFYVSPFIDMDTWFDFSLAVPGEQLQVSIDDYDTAGDRFFISRLSGERKALTNANLLRYFFSIPLITLKVIGLIHWQALKLWWKKIPYHKKESQKELQREVYRPYKETAGSRGSTFY